MTDNEYVEHHIHNNYHGSGLQSTSLWLRRLSLAAGLMASSLNLCNIGRNPEPNSTKEEWQNTPAYKPQKMLHAWLQCLFVNRDIN